MKIYTKTGDKGTTSLYGGQRVPKHHIRIESYGTVDELNSNIGLIRSCKVSEEIENDLIQIQNDLFTIGAMLATPENKIEKFKTPIIKNSSILFLENKIDLYNINLPELTNFILPGGSVLVSYCHIARSICRRAERKTVLLSETTEIQPVIITYLNRLSDFLFVLARKLTYDNQIQETPWVSKK